jgi:hypothetical protein
MPSRDEVTRYLCELPDGDYWEILERADADRRSRFEREVPQEPPAGADRDALAQWLARQHLATDPGITEIYYLQNCPAGEIRLVEVNRLLPLSVPPSGSLEAMDFGLDIAGADAVLFVVDATPAQLESVRAGELKLPQGWEFEPHLRVARNGA